MNPMTMGETYLASHEEGFGLTSLRAKSPFATDVQRVLHPLFLTLPKARSIVAPSLCFFGLAREGGTASPELTSLEASLLLSFHSFKAPCVPGILLGGLA